MARYLRHSGASHSSRPSGRDRHRQTADDARDSGDSDARALTGNRNRAGPSRRATGVGRFSLFGILFATLLIMIVVPALAVAQRADSAVVPGATDRTCSRLCIDRRLDRSARGGRLAHPPFLYEKTHSPSLLAWSLSAPNIVGPFAPSLGRSSVRHGVTCGPSHGRSREQHPRCGQRRSSRAKRRSRPKTPSPPGRSSRPPAEQRPPARSPW